MCERRQTDGFQSALQTSSGFVRTARAGRHASKRRCGLARVALPKSSIAQYDPCADVAQRRTGFGRLDGELQFAGPQKKLGLLHR